MFKLELVGVLNYTLRLCVPILCRNFSMSVLSLFRGRPDHFLCHLGFGRLGSNRDCLGFRLQWRRRRRRQRCRCVKNFPMPIFVSFQRLA